MLRSHVAHRLNTNWNNRAPPIGRHSDAIGATCIPRFELAGAGGHVPHGYIDSASHRQALVVARRRGRCFEGRGAAAVGVRGLLTGETSRLGWSAARRHPASEPRAVVHARPHAASSKRPWTLASHSRTRAGHRHNRTPLARVPARSIHRVRIRSNRRRTRRRRVPAQSSRSARDRTRSPVVGRLPSRARWRDTSKTETAETPSACCHGR